MEKNASFQPTEIHKDVQILEGCIKQVNVMMLPSVKANLTLKYIGRFKSLFNAEQRRQAPGKYKFIIKLFSTSAVGSRNQPVKDKVGFPHSKEYLYYGKWVTETNCLGMHWSCIQQMLQNQEGGSIICQKWYQHTMQKHEQDQPEVFFGHICIWLWQYSRMKYSF